MVSPRPTSLISGETSWLTETWEKPIRRATAATRSLVLGIAVGVHEYDGDRGDALGLRTLKLGFHRGQIGSRS